VCQAGCRDTQAEATRVNNQEDIQVNNSQGVIRVASPGAGIRANNLEVTRVGSPEVGTRVRLLHVQVPRPADTPEDNLRATAVPAHHPQAVRRPAATPEVHRPEATPAAPLPVPRWTPVWHNGSTQWTRTNPVRSRHLNSRRPSSTATGATSARRRAG